MAIKQKINNILNIQLQEITDVFKFSLSISNIIFSFRKCLLVYEVVHAESPCGVIDKGNIRLNSSSGTNRKGISGGWHSPPLGNIRILVGKSPNSLNRFNSNIPIFQIILKQKEESCLLWLNIFIIDNL